MLLMEDNLNELQMSKNRDKKIPITDVAISKVPYVEYKEIPEDEYDIIHELVKQVLTLAKEENDSNEVAITYRMNHDEIAPDEEYIGVSFGKEHEVDPLEDTTSYHLIMSKKDCVVVSLHNHPSLSQISVVDMRFFLEYDSVKLLVIITNLGSISYLVKDSRYNKREAITLYNEVVSMNNEATDLKGYQEAAKHFMKNCYSVGIIYENR